MTIYLIGPRASGKTTVGNLLAARAGMRFVDTDRHMLERDGLTVAEMVEREGWDGFRRRESEALHRVTRPGRVIATGGGMVLSPENRAFMRENGLVLYLAAPAEVLAARLLASPDTDERPSLTGRGTVEEMVEILAEREPLYCETCHHRLDASRDAELVVAEALERMGVV